MRRILLTTVALPLAALAANALAEPPPGYYGSVNRNNPEDLRRTLHELIDDHIIYPLESENEVDIWDILQLADENVDNSGSVITIFRNASYPKRPAPDLDVGFDYGWPKQYGFPDYVEGNIPYTDGHNMFIADMEYASSRNGWLAAGCTVQCDEKPTEVNNGRGGGSGEYPGNSNWTLTQANSGLWTVWNGRKGDIARAIFYTEIRYEGGIHQPTGFPEPQFNFPSSFRPDALIDRTRSGENELEGFYGNRSNALAWHAEDPPDAIESQHHETVAAFQGNRNPFIDHPEWVECLYQNRCTPFEINGGMSDAWYDPDTAGQGFLISVLPSFQLMFVAMFTYDVERPDGSVSATIGEPGHRYITAVGPYSGSTATLIIEQTTGGTFGPGSAPVSQGTDGTMTIEFGGCDNGTVVYDIASIGRQGEIPIQRVAKDNVALCEALEGPVE